jgi:hypothetical protein
MFPLPLSPTYHTHVHFYLRARVSITFPSNNILLFPLESLVTVTSLYVGSLVLSRVSLSSFVDDPRLLLLLLFVVDDDEDVAVFFFVDVVGATGGGITPSTRYIAKARTNSLFSM